MSMTKRNMENKIAKLAKENDYEESFLWDIWEECMEEGDTWAYFVAVTEEKDW